MVSVGRLNYRAFLYRWYRHLTGEERRPVRMVLGGPMSDGF